MKRGVAAGITSIAMKINIKMWHQYAGAGGKPLW